MRKSNAGRWETTNLVILEASERHGTPRNAKIPKQERGIEKKKKFNSPPYQVLSLPTQMHVIGDDKVMRPIDNLLVRLVRSFRTEGRIPDETLEHDGAQRPPITLVSVSLLQENLGRDVIRRPDRRICLHEREQSQRIRIPFK